MVSALERGLISRETHVPAPAPASAPVPASVVPSASESVPSSHAVVDETIVPGADAATSATTVVEAPSVEPAADPVIPSGNEVPSQANDTSVGESATNTEGDSKEAQKEDM